MFKRDLGARLKEGREDVCGVGFGVNRLRDEEQHVLGRDGPSRAVVEQDKILRGCRGIERDVHHCPGKASARQEGSVKDPCAQGGTAR